MILIRVDMEESRGHQHIRQILQVSTYENDRELFPFICDCPTLIKGLEASPKAATIRARHLDRGQHVRNTTTTTLRDRRLHRYSR